MIVSSEGTFYMIKIDMNTQRSSIRFPFNHDEKRNSFVYSYLYHFSHVSPMTSHDN